LNQCMRAMGLLRRANWQVLGLILFSEHPSRHQKSNGQHLVDAAAIEIDYLKPPTRNLNRLACRGQVAQMGQSPLACDTRAWPAV
jgi:hypothetical protein